MSGEMYEHEISIKIEWEGDTINTAFRRSIESILLFSNQQILLHNCIGKLHSARQCPKLIVNLTLRSALIGCFHCSSTCRRDQVRNSGEMYEHENSNKIESKGDTINTQRICGILTVAYELLKWLCCLETSITWCDRLRCPTDEQVAGSWTSLPWFCEVSSWYNMPKRACEVFEYKVKWSGEKVIWSDLISCFV